ncbi:hypothetical protein N2601_08725 [Rhizobium sp. CB3060]|uniref:hypothetical protein n=1 Tax=Rhizobium sp. CB3060 TaxID=3138255 RepID=UPI0021A77F72|nr:hypothetical protein [Rhizobium tropici]UWU23013.1 hypothetical protein N2601_08725 [Rhizobium tropici]
MVQTRIERLARFFSYASDPSKIDLTDDLALDQAYEVALDQFRAFARKGAGLQELIAMEKLISELADLLQKASGEKVEHAGRVDRALSGTRFGYANGRLGPRRENGFAWIFSMHRPAK